MKLKYESPVLFAELFVPNQYVAACGDTVTTIDPMTVRCQSNNHQNIAQDTIFLESNTACEGKYNSSLTDDKCHGGHGGASGTGFVNGTWGTKTTSGQDGYLTAQWFTEKSSGSDVAYKGYFTQDGHRHLFYATTEQAELFQGS